MRQWVNRARDFRQQFQLERKLARLQRECDRGVCGLEFTESLPTRIEFQKRINAAGTQLDRLVSKSLIEKAQRMSIEIPDDCWHNEVDPDFPGFMPLSRYLHSNGQRTVRKLIRKEQRENIEWWVRVVGPILTLIVSILGLVVAAITVLRN
jgi:hypothetical protein